MLRLWLTVYAILQDRPRKRATMFSKQWSNGVQICLSKTTNQQAKLKSIWTVIQDPTHPIWNILWPDPTQSDPWMDSTHVQVCGLRFYGPRCILAVLLWCGCSKYETVGGSREPSPLSRDDAGQHGHLQQKPHGDTFALEQLILPVQSATTAALIPHQQVPTDIASIQCFFNYTKINRPSSLTSIRIGLYVQCGTKNCTVKCVRDISANK